MGCCPTTRDDDVYLEPHQLGRERGEAIEFSLCRSTLDDNVLSFHVPNLAEPLAECLGARSESGKGGSS